MSKSSTVSLLFILLLLCSNLFGATQTLRFFTSFDTPDAKLAQAILEEAFKQNNYQITFIIEPYRRSISRANTEGDGEVLRVENLKKIDPEITHNLIPITEPILEVPVFVVNHSPISTFSSYSDLKPYKNGVLKGIRILEENVPNIFTLSSYSNLFKMLKKKRIDNFITSDYFIEEITYNTEFKPQLYIHILLTINLHTYLNSKHYKLINPISITLKKMKQNGTYKHLESSIRNKYYSLH
ncbi:transporter substrate-binding domain-containing protein [Zooshikella harenae]|uniref:ABC transporter substrate-binding protein n=1 Tax=Zooshikella harenae TaxID=2827238 RepID=A0ABS5ZHV2_9GAMM|nr:transporter substrate-binding domain-containing protein [Zooshikella harenae]MBU2713510.1 ABC transporter substrate-binding protein [Zooshikella harenae]